MFTSSTTLSSEFREDRSVNTSERETAARLISCGRVIPSFLFQLYISFQHLSNKTSVWENPWYPLRLLLSKFPQQLLYSSTLSKTAKLFSLYIHVLDIYSGSLKVGLFAEELERVYGNVNVLRIEKECFAFHSWVPICEATNKLLGIASIPLDEQTEARSTINGLKPLKKLGYGVIMGFRWRGVFSISDDADDNFAWFLAYSASQMMHMIILLITGTNKDGGYQIGNAGELLDSSDKAQTLNVKTKRLFVTRLSFYTSEKTLGAAFEGFGELVEVKIIMDRMSKRFMGYAFLEYTTEEAESAALKEICQ
ncbi:hypothetical protein GIB67_009084, partial [Kingdonia uniflora]